MLGESLLLERDAFIGRQLVGGTDRTRQRVEKIRRRARLAPIANREQVASRLGGEHWIDRQRGHAVLPSGTLPQRKAVIEHATAALGDQDTVVARSTSGKPELVSGLIGTLEPGSPLLDFALNEVLLGEVSRYLGVVPILSQVDVWFSLHRGGSQWRDSQMFHCDWESTTKVRVFVYASDVDEHDGPLTVVDADRSALIREQVGYRYLPSPVDRIIHKPALRIPDNLVDAPRTELTGNSGTVALVDTSRCLHFGSRMTAGRTRLLTVFQYLPPTAFELGLEYTATAPYREFATPQMTELQAMTLGAIA
jgi:hypothetical protein